MCLSCTNIWAAYFAELFPVRLRPMGTSLFHGGHVVSLFAPIIVTVVAAHSSLIVGMALAPATFLLRGLIWAFLPETLRTGSFYRGFSAEAARYPAPSAGNGETARMRHRSPRPRAIGADVAAAAGVSQSAVSRTFRKDGSVAPDPSARDRRGRGARLSPQCDGARGHPRGARAWSRS